MKAFSTLGIVIFAAAGLCACNPTVDFSGTYDGLDTYAFTNCTGGTLQNSTQTDEFDIGQSGTQVTATAQGAACTMTGTASGDTVTVDPASCGTFQDTQNGTTMQVTYSITGGTFAIDDSSNLDVDVTGTASYQDSSGNDIDCSLEITGSLPETS